jgi:nucleoside-diphosphate-sugar epimerase
VKTALVLGGTRFVGKRLVALLREKGVAVTVGTRGRSPVPEGVRHIKLDRFDPQSLRSALATGEWDIVYDQQCYTAEDSTVTMDLLKGRVKRYVLCSSGAVYRDPGRTESVNASENEFDPLNYPIRLAGRGVDYGEGKRQSEAVLFQRGTFSSVAVRFPIILGPDDYTKRLRIQVRRIAQGEPVNVGKPASEISLVASRDAAEFLLWLSTVEETGPFNACSIRSIALSDIISMIESVTGKSAMVRRQPDEDPFSLFWAASTFSIDPSRAEGCGFAFLPGRGWLSELIRDEASQQR